MRDTFSHSRLMGLGKTNPSTKRDNRGKACQQHRKRVALACKRHDNRFACVCFSSVRPCFEIWMLALSGTCGGRTRTNVGSSRTPWGRKRRGRWRNTCSWLGVVSSLAAGLELSAPWVPLLGSCDCPHVVGPTLFQGSGVRSHASWHCWRC